MSRIYFIVIMISFFGRMYSQNTDFNENYLKSQNHKITKIKKTKFAYKPYVTPAILVGLGLFTMKKTGFLNKYDIRGVRNRYLPNYSNSYADYLQLVPMVTAFGLDLVGVKGKHTLGRKAASTAITSVLAVTTLQGLKHLTKVRRPDNEEFNSFPSGHTATAFMSATILHKEYGHKSKWYSIAGYALATATGFFRGMTDRHWSSDILVGAGLGIGLTELGYFITGKIYKDKGVNGFANIKHSFKQFDANKPHFIGMRIGSSLITGELSDSKSVFYLQNGYMTGLEGAYFFNKNIGLGGELTLVTNPLKVNDSELNQFALWKNRELGLDDFGFTRFYIGPFFNFRLNDKTSITAKITAGKSFSKNGNIYLKEKNDDENHRIFNIINYKINDPFGVSIGLGVKQEISRTLLLGAYMDYNMMSPELEFRRLNSFSKDDFLFKKNKISLNSINIGASLSLKL